MNNDKISANIDAFMKLNNISVSDLGRLLDVSPSTLARKRRDPSRYTLGELALIARACKCAVSDLIDERREWLKTGTRK